MRVGVYTWRDMTLVDGDWLRVVGPMLHLRELGCEVVFFAPSLPAILESRVDFVRIPGRPGENDPYRRLLLLQAAWRPLRFAPRCVPAGRGLAALLNSHRLDLVHCHGHSGGLNLLRFRERLRMPVALDVHTIYALQLEKGATLRERLAWRVTCAGERNLFREMDSLVVESEAEKEFMAGEFGVSRGRVHVARSGADVEFLGVELPDAEKESLRAELGIRGGRVLLFGGGLKAASGIMDLLEAYRLLTLRRSDLSLLIVGDVSETTAHVLEFVRRNGLKKVFFLGRRPREGYRLLQQISDAVVVPDADTSFTRLFLPLKAYDALCSGRPAVMTRIPGRTDGIEDGATAYLVNPNDPQDLARGLERALEDPRAAEVADRARQMMVEKYTWRHAAEGMMQAYSLSIAAGKADRHG